MLQSFYLRNGSMFSTDVSLTSKTTLGLLPDLINTIFRVLAPLRASTVTAFQTTEGWVLLLRTQISLHPLLFVYSSGCKCKNVIYRIQAWSWRISGKPDHVGHIRQKVGRLPHCFTTVEFLSVEGIDNVCHYEFAYGNEYVFGSLSARCNIFSLSKRPLLDKTVQTSSPV